MTVSRSSAISPKIAMIFDQNHHDPLEIAITAKLFEVNPQENIIFFCENRIIETPLLSQYSVELLDTDKKISTANSCQLLIGHILANYDPFFLKVILGVIYSDSYLKTLFIGKHYTKYLPNNFGLEKSVSFPCFKEEALSPAMNNAITNVIGLFKFFDKKLSKIPPKKREEFFEGHLAQITLTMINTTDRFDIRVFDCISEALAFLKIREVHKKLNPQEDISKELSLSLINQLYGGEDSVDELVQELNIKFRTQFQANKVIRIVERILQQESQDPNTIFVVRLGALHKEVIMDQLTQYFINGDVKEIFLSQEDLPQIEKRIQDQFS